MTIPEAVVLAVCFELGLAGRAELSDFVDRGLESDAAPSEALLELATPSDMAPDDVARRLFTIASTDPGAVARAAIVIVADLVDRGAITLEHAVGYLCVRVAPALDGPLASRCGGLDDMLALALTGTWGTEADVRAELSALADECREETG